MYLISAQLKLQFFFWSDSELLMLIGLMERRRGGVDINILQLQLMNSVIKLFIDKMSSNVQGCVIMKLMWHIDLRSIINMWHPYCKTTHIVFSIEFPLCKRELLPLNNQSNIHPIPNHWTQFWPNILWDPDTDIFHICIWIGTLIDFSLTWI